MHERLSRRIGTKREDLIDLTQALVRIPTVNPPGENYAAIVTLLAERLAARGFDVETVRAEGTPGDSDVHPRLNLVARREGRGPGACVHFNGHIDVVAVGENWTVEPFGGALIDGRIYGRGACDMKGGLAAAIIAVEAFLEEEPDFPGAVEISATADEETGGFGGVAHLARLGYFSRPRVDSVIIPEPLGRDRICLGHRGVWWAEIETKGRIAHGSMPFLGDNAVRHMGAVLAAFEAGLFPSLELRTTAMPVIPAGARRSTLNLNSIHGGEAEGHGGLPAPVVPDSCRMTIDRRFPAEEDLDAVKGEVRAILDDLVRERPGFRYSMRDVMEVHPSMTPRDAPVCRALADAISQALGKPADFVVSPGSYDQKHIDRIGRLRDCIAYGPGILELAHQPDEYVTVDDMVDSALVMALALHGLLLRA